MVNRLEAIKGKVAHLLEDVDEPTPEQEAIAFCLALLDELADMPESPGGLSNQQLAAVRRMWVGRMRAIALADHREPVAWDRILVGAFREAGNRV